MKALFPFLLSFLLLVSNIPGRAQPISVLSPDKQLKLEVSMIDGKPMYTVARGGRTMLESSPLGLTTNEGDFSAGMKFLNKSEGTVDKTYTQEKIKKSNIRFRANKLVCTFENAQQKKIDIVFLVGDNDIAFRYELPSWGPRLACVIGSETTGFRFPEGTTTFLSGMMTPMTGFARTTPSYETGYEIDAPMRKDRPHPEGYVFPGLFRVKDSGWVLVSETGVSSQYCGSHLGEYSKEGVYRVEYPDQKQNNGFGHPGAALSLPGVTPWRTITLGATLKPIVETTIPYDVVEPLYEASQAYAFGRATWSWIVWQDASMNYDDQVKYVDLAASLGYEYVLMDALWDTNIGKERMKTLVSYAAKKKVGVFLWYNSNGPFNDAPQGPRNKMSTAIERKKEMKWLREIGVRGLKVDFFGGDKQETMRLYEDILSDANDYGLMIDFHGTTLPRGWERMYPNYIGGEAVVASEMLIFSQDVRNSEAVNATILPFTRNAVGSMEFGGVFLNKYLVKNNQVRNRRLTTDAFQLATSVLFQNPVQMFALTPNNLTDAPKFVIDFMKGVPTTWDETHFIDGYPGKYCVIARRHKDQWYVAGVNGTGDLLKLSIDLSLLGPGKVKLYSDGTDKISFMKDAAIVAGEKFEIQIQAGGGFVITR